MYKVLMQENQEKLTNPTWTYCAQQPGGNTRKYYKETNIKCTIRECNEYKCEQIRLKTTDKEMKSEVKSMLIQSGGVFTSLS